MRKNWQKVVAIVLVLALCVAVASVFAACGKTVGDTGTVSIVVAPAQEGGKATEYVVDLSKLNGQKGLVTVLDYLKDNKGLTYTISGTYLTSVNDLIDGQPKGTQTQYLWLYTTVEANASEVSDWSPSMQYKGITLYSSNKGAADMIIEDGAVIYVGTILY